MIDEIVKSDNSYLILFSFHRKVGQRANLEAVANVGSQKTKLKKVKSSIKLQNVFRRVSQGSHKNSTTEAPNSNGGEDKKPGVLFCRPLDEVCADGRIPKPIRVSYEHHIYL